MKKIIFLLNIDNYAPKITTLTYPLIYYYANKIGAEVYIIKERKFPNFPPVYEKLQIYELARKFKCEWAIYIDSDALVSPDTIDFTHFLPKNCVAHNGCDFANVRWKYDNYFLRDGRNIGSCNWFTIASEWCFDLWEPLTDLTLEEALSNIYIVMEEENSKVITQDHLIDDYVLSRNIAKYSLHFTTIIQLNESLKVGGGFWHDYIHPEEQKIHLMKQVLDDTWKVPKRIRDYEIGK